MWERFNNLVSTAPSLLLASTAILLPIIVAFLRRAYLTFELKTLLSFLLTYLVFDISEWILALFRINNMYLHNISELAGMLITGFLYYRILINSRFKQRIVIVLISLVILQNILQFSWGELAGYSFTLNKVVLISFVFLHFHSIITEMKITNILLHSPFWISSAFMVFSCGMLFIYLFWNYTLSTSSQKEIFRLYSDIEQIFRIISLILFSFGFWTSKFANQNV